MSRTPAETDPRAQTTALIKRYYAAFNAGVIEGMLACLVDDVAHDVNQGGRRHGKAAFAEFSRHMARFMLRSSGTSW